MREIVDIQVEILQDKVRSYFEDLSEYSILQMSEEVCISQIQHLFYEKPIEVEFSNYKPRFESDVIESPTIGRKRVDFVYVSFKVLTGNPFVRGVDLFQGVRDDFDVEIYGGNASIVVKFIDHESIDQEFIKRIIGKIGAAIVNRNSRIDILNGVALAVGKEVFERRRMIVQKKLDDRNRRYGL